MTPSRNTLRLAGVLELVEKVCAFYGYALADVLVSNPRNGNRVVRNVVYAAMYRSGWQEDRIAVLFGAKLPTVEAALDEVKDCEARRFAPRKAS